MFLFYYSHDVIALTRGSCVTFVKMSFAVQAKQYWVIGYHSVPTANQDAKAFDSCVVKSGIHGKAQVIEYCQSFLSDDVKISSD